MDGQSLEEDVVYREKICVKYAEIMAYLIFD